MPLSFDILLVFLVKPLADEPRAMPVLSMADLIRDNEGTVPVAGCLQAKVVAVTCPGETGIEVQSGCLIETKTALVARSDGSGLGCVPPKCGLAFSPTDHAEEIALSHHIEAVLYPLGDIAPDVLMCEDKKVSIDVGDRVGVDLHNAGARLGLSVVKVNGYGIAGVPEFFGLVGFV